MNLTRKQFDLLEVMATNPNSLSQRDLERATGYSLGTINRVIKELAEEGFAANGRITNDGINALEPYRAKRAIFIAAGFGTRLVPITFNTPKPLVRVHSVRIIDRLIDACLEAGINEIYIVRGYLGELFDQLLYKYPMIKFLENPVYNEASTERPEALEAGDFILAGITTDELLNATSMAIEMKQKGVLGKPCPDYVDETVSMKVVRIIQGYVGVVNKMVWRKY